jgi:hypothetical protein
MKIILIMGMIVIVASCIILIGELNSRMNLPYENERYFDESNEVVYHSQTIAGIFFILIICILTIIFILFILFRLYKSLR